MRRLVLTSAAAVIAFLVSVPPAWAEWVWPLRGEVITPYRNGHDPYASGQHRGIDIAGDVGAPVVAAAGGEVRFAGTAGSSGLTVSVRTDDGRYDTSYLHLSSTAVREGDRIAAGARIGAVGTSGLRSAATPHLHFGVRDAGTRHSYHDPLGFLPPPPGPPAPREAPAPQPSPAPIAPVPAPVRVPAGQRVPVRAPAGRRVPVRAPGPGRVPVGAPGPGRVPAGAPGPRRVPVGAPGPRRVPVGAPGPGRVPVGAPGPGRVPVGAPSPQHAPVDAPDSRGVQGATRSDRPSLGASPGTGGNRNVSPRPATPSNAAPPPADSTNAPSSGPDLGLVLACVGLLLAALLLGFTDDGRNATRKTGHGVARFFQPMLGRR